MNTPTQIDADRRTLLKVATGAGVVAAAGVVTAAAAATQTAVEDPKAPEGMGQTGIPDQRFPLCYGAPVINGTRVVIEHLTALGKRDIEAVADTLHFPFGTYESTEAVVVDTPDALIASPPASLNMTTNPRRHSPNDGYLKPGTYDVFVGLEVLACTPVNTCIALTYDRYGSDGKKLLRCDGMYAVTNNDGRWAIQAASTIFTPADMIGVVFEDAVRAAKALRINHTLSAQTGHEEFDRQTVQLGRQLNVSGGASWTEQMKGPARIMESYRVKGVKSRLRIADVTPDTPLRGERGTYQEYWDTMGKIGLGPWGFIYGTWKEGRVVHHTANKAHVLTAAVRYTAAGEEMSVAVQAMVATYKKGHWGMGGNYIYATPHDRANDIGPGRLQPV